MNLKLKVFVERNLSFVEASWQPFTRTNRSPQSPFLIVEMVYWQDLTTPDHIIPWHLCLCLRCKAKFFLGIPKTSMDEIFIGTDSYKLCNGNLPLVPGSATFAQCCTRYHPSGTMVPLPCHPPLFLPGRKQTDESSIVLFGCRWKP